ncbi:MAG: hypothetical protein GXP45_04790 [bacterium]|nr:hypothetical protein [bacterium]
MYSGHQYYFTVDTSNRGGNGYIVAYIDTGILPLNKQKPGTANLLVQKALIPEE